ncbi:hypothetical protein [Aequorivita echinoideorum]|uniref:Uncharacterized protein n=1 Tax=Aequorivita echinoideorum TaxID=1549647 RepID=A0ABS5S5M2_9FLAO|nr:hypothetical protein [Aequorivita echinoideorum]MBT0608521.1 hypothetical protein [Aequorivita echinoideorum]
MKNSILYFLGALMIICCNNIPKNDFENKEESTQNQNNFKNYNGAKILIGYPKDWKLQPLKEKELFFAKNELDEFFVVLNHSKSGKINNLKSFMKLIYARLRENLRSYKGYDLYKLELSSKEVYFLKLYEEINDKEIIYYIIFTEKSDKIYDITFKTINYNSVEKFNTFLKIVTSIRIDNQYLINSKEMVLDKYPIKFEDIF